MVSIHTGFTASALSRRHSTGSRIRSGWCLLCALFLTLYCLVGGADCAKAVREGLSFCAAVLVPSLFPFLVIGKYFLYRGYFSRFCAAFGKHLCTPFRLSPPCAAAMICGILCGFPMGAAMTAQLYGTGAIRREEAERLAGFSTLCGPAFLFGCIPAVTGNPRAGILLFSAQLCAAVCTGLLFSLGHVRAASVPYPLPSGEPRGGLVRAVTDSVLPMLTVCGFVAFFAVVNQTVIFLLSAVGMPQQLLWLASGILDLTEGIRALGGMSGNGTLLRASFLVGWSGICVHMQSASFLIGAGLSVRQYTAQKAVCGLLCVLFCAGLAKIFC